MMSKSNTFSYRLKVPAMANVQMGKIVNGNGQNLAQSRAKNNAVAAGAATLGQWCDDEKGMFSLEFV